VPDTLNCGGITAMHVGGLRSPVRLQILQIVGGRQDAISRTRLRKLVRRRVVKVIDDKQLVLASRANNQARALRTTTSHTA
jgi:hypothetical protein